MPRSLAGGNAVGARHHRMAAVLIGVLMLACAPAVVAADPKAPDPAAGDYGAREIPRAGRAATTNSTNDGPLTQWPLSRIALALGVVVGLIFALRWAGRRFLSLPNTGGAGGAVQVLARTTIGPRQQLMLIQVGRRLVVVANCSSQMSSLCEITDPDEIAELTAQVRRQASPGIAGTFGAIFGRAGKQFEAPSEDAAVPPAEETEDAGETDPAVAAAQRELSGLKQKVREMARQFDRT